MMVEADETTLCSYNYRTDRNTRSFSMTDSEPDVDHRERALRALTARRSSTLSSRASNESNNDYTLFLADAATSVDARHRRSAAAWAELEQRTAAANHHRISGNDHLIPRQSRAHSAYLGLPGSTYDSSRPGSSVAMSIHEYVRPAQTARAW
jgi:hypothetical protein